MNIWQEGLKCSQDFKYFCTQYIKIIDTQKGIIPLEMHPFHEKMIDLYDKSRFTCVIKFRGSSLSTFTLLYGLWQCLFHENQSVFVLCTRYSDAKNTCKTITDIINLLPEWMQAIMIKNTSHEKKFATNSRMDFYTWEAVRGRSITHLIIEEADFNKKLNEEWRNIFPALGNNGKCFALSTTNKIGGWFQETYYKAVHKQNDFVAYAPSYLEHPNYQNKEHCDRVRAALGEEGWQQEVLGNWLIHQV